MKMFAILVLILMSSQINCNSICDTIKPNGVFKGLQVYRKYESIERNHLLMNNRNGIEWQFNITSDGQYSHKMNDSMANTTVDALHRFGVKCNFSINSEPFEVHMNCEIFARNASHLEVKCDPTLRDIISIKIGDYVIIPVTIIEDYNEILWRIDFIYFFDRKTKDIELVFNSFDEEMHECYRNKTKICLREHPPFVQLMDNTLFSSIEGVVDFKSSDGKSYYFLLFRIDGRPKFCVTSADGTISSKCKSSEDLTNLFEECFETSHTSNSFLFWVLIVVALLVVVIVIAFVIVFLRRQRSEENTEMSSFHMISSNPTI